MSIFNARAFTNRKCGAAIRAVAIFWLVSAGSGSLSAAQANKATGVDKLADAEWQEIKNLGAREFQSGGGLEARQEFAKELVRDAERLEKFQAKHPDHAEVKEAKRREALALIQAWQAGDESRESRRKQLVADFRQDLSVPVQKRSEIAAFHENIGVEKRANLSAAARLAAYEGVARKLAEEFPELPDAYEALVQIAKDSSDERARAIAKEVVAMDRAPAWVKKEAKALGDRYDLVGKNIVEPTKVIIAEGNPFSKAMGSRLVVYTWSTQHAPSIARAKALTSQLPAGAKLIGVCLDQGNLAPAKACAQAEVLPGEQIYDWLGRRGEIAEALGAVDPGLIYLIDATGVVRSVSAHRDLPTALAALSAQ